MGLSMPITILLLVALVSCQKQGKPMYPPSGGGGAGGKGLISEPVGKQTFLNGIGPLPNIETHGGGYNGVNGGPIHGRIAGPEFKPDFKLDDGSRFNGNGFGALSGGPVGLSGRLVPMERITKEHRTTEHHFGGVDDHRSFKGHDKGNILSGGIAGPNVRPVPRPIPVPIPRPRPIVRHRTTRIPIPVPYPVPRPVPVPITRTRIQTQPIPVPLPVRVPYPVTVPQPVAVRIPHPVHVQVPRPYPVHIPQPYPVPVGHTTTQHTNHHGSGCSHGYSFVGGRCVQIGYEHYSGDCRRGESYVGGRCTYVDYEQHYRGRSYRSGYSIRDYMMAGLLGDFDMGFRDNDMSDLAMLYLLGNRGIGQFGRQRQVYNYMRGGGFGMGYGGGRSYGRFGYDSQGYSGYGGYDGYGGYGGSGGRGGSSGSEGGSEGGEGGSGGSGQGGYYWQSGDNDSDD